MLRKQYTPPGCKTTQFQYSQVNPGSSNGRTGDFGSPNPGSNPGPGTAQRKLHSNFPRGTAMQGDGEAILRCQVSCGFFARPRCAKRLQPPPSFSLRWPQAILRGKPKSFPERLTRVSRSFTAFLGIPTASVRIQYYLGERRLFFNHPLVWVTIDSNQR